MNRYINRLINKEIRYTKHVLHNQSGIEPTQLDIFHETGDIH